MQFDKNLAWIDIETTGLTGKSDLFTYGQRDHLILELALVITDPELNVLYETSYVVDHEISQVYSYISNNANELKIHTNSGLLEALKDKNETMSLYRIENCMMDTIKHYCGTNPNDAPIMAGSSIYFNRAFIQAQMPRLNDVLHYRNFDTSTLKMFHDMVFDTPLSLNRDEPKHRALDDIQFSLDLTREIKHKFQQRGLLCYLKNLWK